MNFSIGMKVLPNLLIVMFMLIYGISQAQQSISQQYPVMGHIERIDPQLDEIIPANAKIERIATGLEWAEGPLWVETHQMLLCSDVKMNRIYRWTADDGLSEYLEPSGFTGAVTTSREKGSNGLTLNAAGELILCQHGNRQIARMSADLNNPQPLFETIVGDYKGKRFNSPNDLHYDSNGNLYFTDPPYGLSEAMMADPLKELDFQGVYKYSTDGKLTLMTSVLSRPNGLVLSKDEQTMYVSNSDENMAAWYAFDVKPDTLINARIIFDASDLVGKEIGFPDGIKVDGQGNIFTAGPGGIWIFSENYELLGKIKPGVWASNCNFNEDYSVLYITADDHLLRVKLK